MANKLLHPVCAWQKLAYLFVSALTLGLCMCFPTAVGAVIEWIAFVPAALVLFCLAEKPRRAYLYGFFFFYIMYFATWHWVVNLYPLDFVGLSKAESVAVVALAWLGLPLIAAIVGGFVFLVFARLGKNLPSALLPFLAAALWVIFEWTQTLTWAGVPWGRLAIGQLVGNFTATAITASLFGSYFVSALIIATSCLAAQALFLGKLKWRVTVAFSLAFGNLLCGVLMLVIPTQSRTVKVAAVQGNFSSHDGYSSYSSSEIWARYEKYTKLAAAEGAEIVLWPESVFVSRVIYDGGSLSRSLSRLASECGATVAVGGFQYNDERELLNCIATFYSDGTNEPESYAKRKLVPFGEYVPMQDFFSAVIPPLAELSKITVGMVSGDSTSIAKEGDVHFGGLICFDSIYETLAIDSVRDGAELLLLSTNDSWFGDSCALDMHVAQARLRAIENSRGVLRSASTGISCVISPTGKIDSSLGANKEGYVIADVELTSRKTPYTVMGNVFVYASWGFVLSLLGTDVYKRCKSRD